MDNAAACLRWLTSHNLKDGHRASAIISRIRALMRKVPMRKDWMDMNETIRDILVLIRPELEAHHEDIETRLHDDVHAIWGDRIQIQQVMLNLAMNVMEAMDGINETCRWLVIES